MQKASHERSSASAKKSKVAEANKHLKRERELRGWSQSAVAEKIGAQPKLVNRWETGHAFPSPYYREKLCYIFEKDAEALGLLRNRIDEPFVKSANHNTMSALMADELSYGYNGQEKQEDILKDDSVAVANNFPVEALSLQERDRYGRNHFSRQRMIEQVASIWITGMLQQSLHGAKLIAVRLREESEVVVNPWRSAFQEMEQSPQLLPEGTTIIQSYDRADGHLLILGEPGAGKTTLLLELARELLERASKDIAYPIPVVFNLSSWVEKRQPLAEWLIEELHTKYQVPRLLAKEWVETDSVLPLLDGFDEVAVANRSGCIEAMNRYLEEHGLAPIVVCSRYEDYLEQASRVRLRSAVVVQPLTREQVEDYLASFDEQTEQLRQALRKDEELEKLAKTPLMLNVLTMTYQGRTLQELQQLNIHEDRRRQIFEHYIERMLNRRSAKHHYSSKQTIYWLSWLAKQLRERKQTEFYIEGMQFSWLGTRWTNCFLPVAALGMLYGLLTGLVFGIFNGLFYGVGAGLFMGLGLGIFNSLLYVLLNRVINRGCKQVDGEEEESFVSKIVRPLLPTLERKVVYGLIFAVFNGIFYGLLMGMLPEIHVSLIDRLPFEGVYGLLIGCSYGVQGRLELVVRPTEVVWWSWQQARRRMKVFVVGGILIGLILGAMHPLVVKLFLVLMAGTSSMIVAGISNKELERWQRINPNEGIRCSARNSVLVGTLASLFTWILLSGVLSIFYGPFTGLLYGSIPALSLGICMGLYQGGTAYCLHMMLRVQLWIRGSIPWRYECFLDEAADRILLRKIGGGYIFMHEFLLEYFASLDRKYHDYKQVSKKVENTSKRVLISGIVAAAGGGIITLLTAPLKIFSSPPGTLLYMYMKHTNRVGSVAIAPDSILIASGSDDGTARIWESATGVDYVVIRGANQAVKSLAWSPDGKHVALGNDDGVIQIWDIRERRYILRYEGHINEGKAVRAIWSSNGQMIASDSSDGTVRVWSSKNGETYAVYDCDHSPFARAGIAWSPDNTLLAFGGKGRLGQETVQVWNVPKRNLVGVLAGHRDFIADIAWSPDGKYLATGSFDGTVRIWNILHQQLLVVYNITMAIPQGDRFVYCVDWSPNGKYLLAGGTQGVDVWEVTTGRHLLTYSNHLGRVFSAAWSRNGTYIVSGSSDKTAHVWVAPH